MLRAARLSRVTLRANPGYNRALYDLAPARRVRWSIDVDPIDLY